MKHIYIFKKIKMQKVNYNDLRQATALLDELNMPWVYDSFDKILYTKSKYKWKTKNTTKWASKN